MSWLEAANLAPVMFGSLVVFLLTGFPVAFSLAACGMFFGFIGIELGMMPVALLQALPLRLVGIMQNETLLAIPFFTFMGLILERSGMAEDLLETVGQVFGPVRGGLALAVILVGRDAGGHHRRGRRIGDFDGPDLAADHAALRLQPSDRNRRDHRIGHARPDHSAVAGADRDRRPARPLGRRHVRRPRSFRASCWSACTARSSPSSRSSARPGCPRCRPRPGSTASRTAHQVTVRWASCWTLVDRRRRDVRETTPRSARH
jgi:hypothetical protein